VFLGYAVIGMLAFAFVSVFVTETKGRSLEEIEVDLQDSAAGDEEAARRDGAAPEPRFTRSRSGTPSRS
jgi:hypothetical protein